MGKTTKIILISLGVLALLIIVARAAGWIGKHTEKVAVEKAASRDIVETVTASGKVQPETEVKLSSEVSGEIVQLDVKEGDVVKQGQLLCKIRPDILQSGYDRAVASYNTQKAQVGNSKQALVQLQANFKNIESIYKRNRQLFEQKVITQAEFEQSQADFESAKANLEGARQNIIGAEYGLKQSQAAVKEAQDQLARTTIYAPVNGVVSKLSVEQGERVVGTAQMAGTELMRISNLNTMEVNVDVNENDINRIKLRDTADIEVDAFMGKKFTGVVTEIGSSSNSAADASGTTSSSNSSIDQVTNFTVKIRILPESYTALLRKGEKNESPFRPGLSATVDIRTNKVKSMSVPIQSVTTREEMAAPSTDAADDEKPKMSKPKVKEYVFVLNGGKVKQVAVETGIQNDTYIQIKSGLKGSEEVVSAPYNAISKTLKDGQEVEKVNKDALFAGDQKN
ncbi:MAG: efflux RND transporter periplasmic adaptor subunit [Mucilaginibacter polytrichastri]|nr:efflux RND transporter periplasmic adaptor subunit [Mucilaginibacter polytrichastri]